MDNTIPWYKSRTIWATLIAAISALLSMTGHSIDPTSQDQLVTAASDVANGVAVLASFVAAYYRTKATNVIAPTPKPPTT